MHTRYIDTHCHVNFNRFKKNRSEVITAASDVGVSTLIVPGSNIVSSQKAVELAGEYEGLYAAIGLHPHHVYDVQSVGDTNAQIEELEKLVQHPKVVAIGEVGLDKHEYQKTVYVNYTITPEFLEKQKELLARQIQLAVLHKKSLILHNREAKEALLPLLEKVWSSELEHHTVFHCCEADRELLLFAQKHHLFIGVDGDVTFSKEKAHFIGEVPLEMLVLETDSPFLLPEPLKSQKKYPNVPANIPLIASCVAKIKGIPAGEVAKITTENAVTLFRLPQSE